MPILLTEASKQVGITKAGLVKAIKKGKLTGSKDVHGQWVVEPSELFRVYPPVKPVGPTQTHEVGPSIDTKSNQLERENELQREQINDLREQLRRSAELLDRTNTEKDKLMKLMEEQIVNIRLLTDQREKKTEQGRGLWKKLFG